jgi:hypothetical protein
MARTIRTYATRYVAGDCPVDTRRGPLGEFRAIADWVALPEAPEGSTVSVALFRGSGTRTFTVENGVRQWAVPEGIMTVSATSDGDFIIGTGPVPKLETVRHGQMIRVPTVAALQDLPDLPEGTEILCEQIEDSYLVHYHTHPADGNFTIASASGLTTFHRVGMSQPGFALVTDWYWDPVGGSDLNTGETEGAPLRTWREIQWRILQGGKSDSFTVHVMGDSTEIVRIDPALKNLAFVLFLSHPHPLYGGDLDWARVYGPTALTAYQAANTGTRAEPKITAPGLSAANVVGLVGRVVSGPRVGAQFTVYEDLGADALRVGQPLAGIADSTPVDLQAGDTIEIYQWRKLDALVEMDPTEVGFGAQLAFSDLEIGHPGEAHSIGANGGVLFFDSCILHGFDMLGSETSIQTFNCHVTDGHRAEGGINYTQYGGSGRGVVARNQSTVTVYDVIVSEGAAGVQYGFGYFEVGLGHWLGAIGAEDGLYVHQFAHAYLAGDLWGKEVSGYGIRVFGKGGVLYGTLPNVEAATGDTWIGGEVRDYSALSYTNHENGACVRASTPQYPGTTSEGWRDMIGQITPPTSGANVPTFTTMGTSVFQAYAFDIDDRFRAIYHFQHDYKPGGKVLLHVHWTTNGTKVQPVKWEFIWAYAKGHNQANYNIAGGGTTVTVQEAAQGTAWRHMTSEIAVELPDPGGDFEPDGILMVRLRRVTNGGVENTDTVFVLTQDCHYETHQTSTKNRVPDFYGP